MTLKMVIAEKRMKNMTSSMGRLFRPWAVGKLSTEEIFSGDGVGAHEKCKQESVGAQYFETELASSQQTLVASRRGEGETRSFDPTKNSSRERHRTQHKLPRRARVERCMEGSSTPAPLSQQLSHPSSLPPCSPLQTNTSRLNYPGIGSSSSAFTATDVKSHDVSARLCRGAMPTEQAAANVQTAWLEDLSGAIGPWTAPCCVATPEMLLEGALAQGLLATPAAVEEYARLLQQQHRAAAQAGRKQRPKKHRCPHCQVAFSNNGQLRGHIRIHTGERPYKCDAASCGKTFTRNEELTRHKRIHSGLRPYACGTCGKRFGRKDHLKKHSRTHAAPPRPTLLPLHVPLMQQHFPYLYGF